MQKQNFISRQKSKLYFIGSRRRAKITYNILLILVTNGTVHEKEAAKEIYEDAKRKGKNAGLTTQSELRDTSFNTKVNIPARQDAYFWLNYEQHLARSRSKYQYLTNLNTFGDVEHLEVNVNIQESRPLLTPVVTLPS